MPDLLAGSRILALDSPPAVAAAESVSYDATITGYGVASSAGSYSEVAVVFTAPTSGRVRYSLSARLINSGTGGSMVTAEVRTGNAIGAGTIVDSPTDATGVSHYGATFARAGISHFLSGLTPGDAYNVRMLHRVTGGTGSFAMRELIVEPLP